MRKNLEVFSGFETARPQLEKIFEHFASEGVYVVEGKRNVIKKVTVNNEVYNIKKFKTPGLLQSLVYRYLRKSKAKRSFEYAKKLVSNEINTPLPVAYCEFFSVGLRESYYVSKHLDYDFDFRVLIHQPKFPERTEILKQFADFTYKLHECNVNFLDHSPGNTLIVKKDKGIYDFFLIDLNRMRFETMSFEKRMHNFRRLWLSKTMIKIISKRYAELNQKSYDEIYQRMMYHSRKFQKKINSKKIRRRKRKA